MSSRRTSRKGAAPTPTVSTPPRPERPPSPLSPAKVTRTEEKKTMQNLNDRLASYIDAVRQRDAEIAGLRQERSSIEESHTTEIVQTKAMYNKEIAQLRKAIDSISNEKAKLEITAEKAAREAKDASTELKTKSKELDRVDRELRALQSSYNDIMARLTNVEKESKALRPENDKLQKKLEDAKKNLEAETLERLKLQNELQTTKEQHNFENQMLEQKLNETRTRKAMEISEMDGRLHDEYEQQMQKNLQELRDSYEKQMAENKDQFTQMYEDKLRNLQEKFDFERQNSAGKMQEFRELETKVTGLISRNKELESTNTSLQKRMAELTQAMDDKLAQFRADMARKDAEVKNKEDQMEAMEKDFKDLMDVKVALDIEISAYRKLLEGEEARLGMSPSASPEQRTPAAGRGVKRRRTVIEEEDVFEMTSELSGEGNITIDPIEKGAKCIRIVNKTASDINIGGWTLTNESNGQDSTYKFHRSTTLKSGDICSVWSADADQEHNPPTNLVMKKGGWVIGSENYTTLVNKDGVEEAGRKSWEQKRATSYFRSGSGSTYGAKDGSCSVM